MNAKKEIQKGAFPLLITRIAPFLLPALFFQSVIFAPISPLPLFMLTLKNEWWISLLALFTNIAFFSTANSRADLYIASFLWLNVGIIFPFLIRRFGKVQKSFFAALFIFLFAAFGVLVFLSHQDHLGIVEYLKSQMSLGLDHLTTLPDSPFKKMVEEEGRDGLMHQLMLEFPSGFVISIILAFWINLLFASNLIRGFLSRAFWSSYRNPEWLVWPMLGSAALFAFSEHVPYLIGLNGFKILLLFYAFQGLSIVSFLLNRYKIVGLGRVIIFSLAIFLATPLVFILGFFDLWFDFRKKFGQT